MEDELAGHEPPFTLTDARTWNGGQGSLAVVHIADDGTVGSLVPTTLEVVDESRGPVIGLEGRWLLPGFVDPHVHIRAAASARGSVDISEAVTAAEVLDIVEDAASRTAPDGWVSLWGLQPEELSCNVSPRSEELDRAAAGRPVRIRHRSTHAWLFSTRALDHLGLRSGEAPAGVAVELDDGGRPTGMVVDHGGWLGERMGRITPASRLEDEVRSWSRRLACEGVVALVDATAGNRRPELEQLRDWTSQGVIVQRLAAMTAPDEAMPPPGLHLAGHKIMAPFDPDELRAMIRAAWTRGVGVAVHCVEPSELGAVIEAVEGVPLDARGRLRIEHASVCPPEWIPRVKRIGAAVVTHPGFVYAHGDRYLRDPELQPHEWLYRHASWKSAGVPLAFASDAPAGPSDPLLALRTACSRRTSAGAVLAPEEAMGLEAALWCATIGAAQIAGIPSLGDLVPRVGAPADLVVVRPGPQGLLDEATVVEATMVAGHVVA